MVKTHNVTRRSFIAAGGASIAAFSGCLGGIGGGESETVKIGAPTALSGPYALLGQENRKGWKFAKEQLDGEILGNEYELITEDSQGAPDTGLSKMKKLVEEDNVDAIIGVVNASVGVAIGPYLKQEAKLPTILSQVSNQTTRENSEFCNRYWFFPWPSFRQMNITLTDFISNHLSENVDGQIDTSEVLFVTQNNEAGQTALETFKQEFAKIDGEVVEGPKIPATEKDYSLYMDSLSEYSGDVIAGFMPGAAAIQFISAVSNFGVIEEKEFAFMGDSTSQVPLGALGETADGWFGTHWYDETRDIPMNNEFKSWYASNYDLPPNDFAANGFNQLYSLAQGINEAGTAETDAVIDSLENLSFASPMGELTYRASDHQTKLNFVGYVIDGGSRNILQRYDDVGGPVKCNVGG